MTEEEINALIAERNALAQEVELLRARQEQAPRLSLFISQCPLGLILWNESFAVLEWNPACEAIFGYSRLEALGRHADFIVPEDVRPLVASIFDALMNRTGGNRSTNRNLRKDGSEITVDWFNAPLMDSAGRLLGMVSICEDVTEKNRALEEAQELVRRANVELELRVADRTRQLEATAEQLSQFAYSVSHDLRGPLRSINGFSKALEEDYGEVLDGEAKDYIKRIRAGTMRLSALIDSLLILSRVTRAEMKITEVNLSALAESIVEDIERGIGAQLPKAEYQIQKGLRALGDEALLRAVLNNLLENARKFSGKVAAPKIEFFDQDGAFVVRDNGAGFNAAYGDKLFTPFHRLHAEREFPGDGIGLAVVKRIIGRHDGTIWATSEPGQGASFGFILPRPTEG